MSVVANELCKLIVFHIEDFRNCKCIIFLECIFLYIFKIISDSCTSSTIFTQEASPSGPSGSKDGKLSLS